MWLPTKLAASLKKHEADFRLGSEPSLEKMDNLIINQELWDFLAPEQHKIMAARVKRGI